LFGSAKGLDAGFGEEDGYSVYDKPWRETENLANTIYRPSKNADKDYGEDFEKALGTKRYILNSINMSCLFFFNLLLLL
jgi:SNW domain-containing protein 1